MKTPKFWYKKNTIISKILEPFSKFWLLLCYINDNSNRKVYFKAPIICIGNAIAGGAGKTPLIQEICKEYKKFNLAIHVIYKAYKIKLNKDVLKVNPSSKAEESGDEAILTSNLATTWVCKKREYGINAAISDGATIVLLDDGLQYNSIKKDVNILVANEKQGNGNNKIIPAGPLREPFSKSLKKSDCIFFYGTRKLYNEIYSNNKKKVFFGEVQLANKRILKMLKGENVIAFAGIAHPSNFFNYLKKYNINIIKELYFPDHYIYNKKDLLKIFKLSTNLSAKILTTSKDYVKIPYELRKNIIEIDINIKFNKKMFFNYLNKKIGINV